MSKKNQVSSLMYADDGANALSERISEIVCYYLDDHAKAGDTKAALDALSKYVEKVQAALKIIEKEGF